MATISASLSPFVQPIGMLRRSPLRLVSGVVPPYGRDEDDPLSREPLKLVKKSKKRA